MRAPALSAAHGSDVRLAPFDVADVTKAYAAWLTEPAVVRYTEVDPRAADVAACRAYVEANGRDPDAYLWRIVAGESDHVGNLRLSITPRHRRAEVALLIGDPRLRGRGIGRAAVALAVAHAFGSMGLLKITCGVYRANTASLRMFERLRFQVEGVFLRHVLLDGHAHDVVRLARHADRAVES